MYLALRLSAESEQDIRNGLLWEFEANIPWSTQWGFSPHVTLGRGKVKLTDTFPSVVTFNSMEWRE